MKTSTCKQFLVSGFVVTCPDWLPSTGWSLHPKGYIAYTSRRVQPLIRRGELMHRVILRVFLGRPLSSEEHVHHQDFIKTNNCPRNLLMCAQSMNPSPNTRARCPYTGRFLSLAELRRMVAAA